MKEKEIKKVQYKILEIIKYIDSVCRKNNIEYFIMGGTALGAKRHQGFIPWDDDLDIFMTPSNYYKFEKVFNKVYNDKFVLQEWKIVDDYIEYAKLRMNNTTFIEEAFIKNKDLHQGIYVDIMILHKCPNNRYIKKKIYYMSKYVTLIALSQRNWKPKNKFQLILFKLVKILQNKRISTLCYKNIYKYDELKENFFYCYYITKAKFKEGLFPSYLFNKHIDIKFEDTLLMGPSDIDKYLFLRYGDYMKIPSKEEQKITIHAKIWDTEIGYQNYLQINN